MHNWYKKLNHFLVALLLIAQVFVTPLRAFAQEESTSANIVEVDSALNNEVEVEASSDASETTGEEELEQVGESSSVEEAKKEDEEIMASQLTGYTTSTDFKINANPVQNNAKYGEGKFYITPTFTFADDAVLKNGDTISYTIPDPFKVDAALSTDVAAADGTVIARLETAVGSKIATLTIVNEQYFANLSEDKKITPSFTVVWDHANSPINTPVTFNLEGYPANPLTLTRILVDEEVNAHSKWGSQSSQDLSIVDWRIRVNRDVKAIGNVTLHDIIPDNQELVGPITGLYFSSWNFDEQRGNYLPVGQREFDSNSVQINGNEFTINLGDMSTKGVVLSYQTRIVGPIDKVGKKVYNKLTMTSNEGTFTKDDWFASLRVVDGIGEGARSDRIAFEVKKELKGRELKADEFEFELFDTQQNKVVQTVKNDANGVVKFSSIKFSNVGQFIYKIREKASNLPGVTNDANAEITATVTVTDQGGAKMAVAAYDRETFVNTYKAAPTSVNLTARKTLGGKDLADQQFAFTVNEGDKELEAVLNQADGSVVFKAIPITEAGTRTFVVREVSGVEAGITYDKSVYTATVVTTDDGNGQLNATTTITKDGAQVDGITFTNTYKAAPVTVAAPTVKKALTGKDLEADKYTFELKEGDAVKQAVTNAADGTVTFDGLTFNAPGEYTYTISEKRGTEGGVTYDESVYTWKVTVTDNKAGQLVAATELTKAGAVVKEVAFTNTYTPAPVNVAVQATKTLTGRPLKEGEFEFELVDAKGAVAKATRNTADGTIAFAPITFDRAGEYVYTIREKASNQPGVTDDATPATVTITVTDNKAGQLEAQVAYTKNAFNNAYQGAPVNVVVQTMKTLTGRPLKAGEFEFELVDAQDKVVTKASNTANGAVAFDALTFDKAGEYVYTIREVATTLPGVTNDTETATVTITVVDNLKGQLEATAKYSKENFVNTYKAKDGTATISIAKVLEGRKQAAGEFEFELKDSTGKVLQTAKNTADGQVNFNKLTYDAAGVYEYTVVEKAGNAKGVTYDKEPILVKVTVEDKDAQLETTVEYAEKKGFKNTYVPAPTTAQAQGTTVLKGIDVPAHKERKLEAGQFEFTLTDTQTGQVTKVTNTADGKVVFEGMPYTKAGKYTYKMNELKGTDPSITYSDLEVLVTVDVVDNNGQLEATVSYDKTPEFVNTYTVAPDPISVTLNVKKELSGRELKADEFEFVLFDAAGKEVQTAKNAKDGQVAFTTTFDKEGVSTFKINEKRGNDATIKYADNTVNVEVSVTKEKGVLVAKVTYKDAAVFKNEYKAPTKEEKQLPKTGEWNTGFILPVALFAMVGAVAVLTFKKKQN